MTKAALVEEVSRVADLTKKHSEVIVDTVFRSIIMAYTSSPRTLAYMELTKDDEYPQLGNLELIEEA